MNELFLKVVNMGISASWLILAVLVLRFFMKKAPKWITVMLWGMVAVRLICPFSFESDISLVPSAETIPLNIDIVEAPAIDSGVEAIDKMVNPTILDSFAPQPATSVNPLQIWILIAAVVWIVGMTGMLLYSAFSYIRLRRRVATAVRYKERIFQSESVGSPFVLGIVKPRIYVPFNVTEQELEHVIAHEQAHISRKDHWWKPLGFLLLTIHWFNPLMWVAYVLLCRDIELACDEKVIRKLDNAQRADYTQALVSCSVNRRMIAACPLAFGEVGVKNRVKSVMNYKKPAFWVVLVSVIACIVVAVCFLTNPSAVEGEDIESTVGLDDFESLLCEETGKQVYCFESFESARNPGYQIVGFKTGENSNQAEMKDMGFAVFQTTKDGTQLLDCHVYEDATLAENGIYFCGDPAVVDESGKMDIRDTFDVILISNEEVGKVEMLYMADGKDSLVRTDDNITAPCMSVWAWEDMEGYDTVAMYFYDKQGRQMNADNVILPEEPPVRDEVKESYATLLAGDQSLVSMGNVQWWIPDFRKTGILEYEYTYMDLDGNGVVELLVQMVNDPAGYNGVFHYADGKLFCWNSDAMEGSERSYPLSDGTMVRQYDYNGNPSYTIFRYTNSGQMEEIHNLFARKYLVPEDSSEPCPYYSIDGEEVTKEVFEEILKEWITDKELSRDAWIKN